MKSTRDVDSELEEYISTFPDSLPKWKDIYRGHDILLEKKIKKLNARAREIFRKAMKEDENGNSD